MRNQTRARRYLRYGFVVGGSDAGPKGIFAFSCFPQHAARNEEHFGTDLELHNEKAEYRQIDIQDRQFDSCLLKQHSMGN